MNQNTNPTPPRLPNTNTTIPETYIRLGRGRPACAACKFQRRKCPPNCPLAPYFPAQDQNRFLNVHRLFGVSNVAKQLQKVPEPSRDDAMKSVIYESNLRSIFPVGGCLSVIRDLQEQIIHYTSELDSIHRDLSFYRAGFVPPSYQESNQELGLDEVLNRMKGFMP